MSKVKSFFFIGLIIFLSGCSKPGLEITEEQYGDKLPLTVSSGRLECINGAVIFHANGAVYALNGTARSQGYSPVNSIWKDDPAFFEMAAEISKAENISIEEVLESMGPPFKISIGPVLDSGLKLCKS